jgi:hypothetical protein
MSHTGVDSVEIVEIGSETKSVDCSLDVFFDVAAELVTFRSGPKTSIHTWRPLRDMS